MCFNIKAKSIFAATQASQLMRGKNKQTTTSSQRKITSSFKYPSFQLGHLAFYIFCKQMGYNRHKLNSKVLVRLCGLT